METFLIYALIASALIGAGSAVAADDQSRRSPNAQKDAQRLMKADQTNPPQSLQMPFDFSRSRGRGIGGGGGLPFPGSQGLPTPSQLGRNTLLGQ